MNKRDAVKLVAAHMASWMAASTLAECTGVEEHDIDQMSEADRERLEAAAELVCSRLYRMAD